MRLSKGLSMKWIMKGAAIQRKQKGKAISSAWGLKKITVPKIMTAKKETHPI